MAQVLKASSQLSHPPLFPARGAQVVRAVWVWGDAEPYLSQKRKKKWPRRARRLHSTVTLKHSNNMYTHSCIRPLLVPKGTSPSRPGKVRSSVDVRQVAKHCSSLCTAGSIACQDKWILERGTQSAASGTSSTIPGRTVAKWAGP